MCSISIRPTTNMTNLFRYFFGHGHSYNLGKGYMDFDYDALVYYVGEYQIITYVKKYGNISVYIIKHISIFYLVMSIQLMEIMHEKGR